MIEIAYYFISSSTEGTKVHAASRCNVEKFALIALEKVYVQGLMGTHMANKLFIALKLQGHVDVFCFGK